MKSGEQLNKKNNTLLKLYSISIKAEAKLNKYSDYFIKKIYKFFIIVITHFALYSPN